MRLALVLVVCCCCDLSGFADVVTTKSGDTYTGTITLEDGVFIVESRVEGIASRRKLAKDDVVSIKHEDATQAKLPTPEESATLQAKKDQSKQDDARQQAAVAAAANDKARAIHDEIEELRVALATTQRTRSDAATKSAALRAQADSDVAGAQVDYAQEVSIPHPDNQDYYRTAALQTRDKKVAAIRTQYGVKIALLEAQIAKCDHDLLDLNDRLSRLQKASLGQ